MNFISDLFLAFLIILMILHYSLPAKWRLPVLLVASYLFYATWSLPFIAVILITTSLDYYVSRIIYNSQSQPRRKAALATGLCVNILILGFFKYANFFLDTSHSLAHWLNTSLSLPKTLEIILPLGISFYTFEAISYMVDVYRGKKPAKSWLDYNFYIMYFPHLISGPIVRFEELWHQYKEPLKLPSIERIQQGLELLILGVIFKVFIADTAATLVNPVFLDPEHSAVYMVYLAVLAFTVQIYFDFMGYTHIARGASLLFNLELPLNFNHPYIASNISNFWERWHISLSRWIRDYLYIPLGGSRGSILFSIRNLVITMLIAGAWHGAGWTFILWGAYHGLLLAIYHGYKAFRTSMLHFNIQHPLYQGLSVTVTFICVALGWVLFRAADLPTALVVFSKLGQIEILIQDLTKLYLSAQSYVLLEFVLLLFCCFAGPWFIKVLSSAFRPLPFWLKAHVVCVIFVLCWIMTSKSTEPFIYFQF
jgi:alginate O-acetyltransferase complex protein AlgI